MKNFLFIITISAFLSGCHFYNDDTSSPKNITKVVGEWVFKLQIDTELIPFNTVISEENGQLSMEINNGKESITTVDITLISDSIFIRMPYFNSRFFGKLLSDSLIEGYWLDESRPDNYKIPFQAYSGQISRFDFDPELPSANYDGSWKIIFNPAETEDQCRGIGVFHQNGNYVEGTILTETGDHRFLQGNIIGNTIHLSCFDGSHAFLYAGTLTEDNQIKGTFWSGKHYHVDWVGERNDTFKLDHPDSLTYIKNENSITGLTFSDFNNNQISFNDDVYKNKVLIIQIMGTWCPNCLDESVVFKDLYARYHKQGLEISAIAYERGNDIEIIKKRIARYKKQLGLEYPFLYGGTASKSLASEQFSMLNEIISFPTAIIIDRKGSIRRIHTGFYGPSTGNHYLNFKTELNLFVEELLAETSN